MREGGRGMETGKLFPLLPKMDLNFILEKGKSKVLVWPQVSIDQLMNREHLRISRIVSKL